MVKHKTPWEFKWLYKYLDRQAVMRKLDNLPTEGLECELKRMRAAIKAGTTCFVSYRRGSETWRWHVRDNCIDFVRSYQFHPRSWDPVTDSAPRFGSREALERARVAREMREQARKDELQRVRDAATAAANSRARRLDRARKARRISKKLSRAVRTRTAKKHP